MWVLLAIIVVFIVGLPLLYAGLWRGRFLPQSCVGLTREDYQRRLWRFMKLTLPIWLLMVVQCLVILTWLHPISREQRTFWRGIVVGANLSILFFLVVDCVYFFWELRCEHRRGARTGPNTSEPAAGSATSAT